LEFAVVLILLFSYDYYVQTVSKLKFYLPCNLGNTFCSQVSLFAFAFVRVITSQRQGGKGKTQMLGLVTFIVATRAIELQVIFASPLHHFSEMK